MSSLQLNAVSAVAALHAAVYCGEKAWTWFKPKAGAYYQFLAEHGGIKGVVLTAWRGRK